MFWGLESSSFPIRWKLCAIPRSRIRNFLSREPFTSNSIKILPRSFTTSAPSGTTVLVTMTAEMVLPQTKTAYPSTLSPPLRHPRLANFVKCCVCCDLQNRCLGRPRPKRAKWLKILAPARFPYGSFRWRREMNRPDCRGGTDLRRHLSLFATIRRGQLHRRFKQIKRCPEFKFGQYARRNAGES
jgi:hypothetical protein